VRDAVAESEIFDGALVAIEKLQDRSGDVVPVDDGGVPPLTAEGDVLIVDDDALLDERARAEFDDVAGRRGIDRRLDRGMIGVLRGVPDVRRCRAAIAIVGDTITVGVRIVIEPGAEIATVRHSIAVGVRVVVGAGAGVAGIGHGVAVGVQVVVEAGAGVEVIAGAVTVAVACGF
jgi:hypothetical protein